MLTLEVVYQNDLIVVEQNKANNFIQFIWLKQPNSKELRREVKLIADYIMQQKFTSVLSDVRQRLFVNISDQNWLYHEIFPQYTQIANFKFAYLANTNNLEMLDIYRIQEMIQGMPDIYRHLEIEIFMDKEEAQSWLMGFA